MNLVRGRRLSDLSPLELLQLKAKYEIQKEEDSRIMRAVRLAAGCMELDIWDEVEVSE